MGNKPSSSKRDPFCDATKYIKYKDEDGWINIIDKQGRLVHQDYMHIFDQNRFRRFLSQHNVAQPNNMQRRDYNSGNFIQQQSLPILSMYDDHHRSSSPSFPYVQHSTVQKSTTVPNSTTVKKNISTSVASNIKQSLTCVICYGVLKDAVSITTCGHIYCKGCIEDWFKKSHTCPTCRAKCSIQSTVPCVQIRQVVDAFF